MDDARRATSRAAGVVGREQPEGLRSRGLRVSDLDADRVRPDLLRIEGAGVDDVEAVLLRRELQRLRITAAARVFSSQIVELRVEQDYECVQGFRRLGDRQSLPCL